MKRLRFFNYHVLQYQRNEYQQSLRACAKSHCSYLVKVPGLTDCFRRKWLFIKSPDSIQISTLRPEIGDIYRDNSMYPNIGRLDPY